MAKLVAKVQLDMDQLAGIAITIFDEGTQVVANATTVTVRYTEPGLTEDLSLTGSFSNYQPDGYPGSGTITGAKYVVNGVTALTIASASLTVTEFRSFLATGDTAGLFQRLFSGNDTLNGSSFADVLVGYNGNDTIDGKGGADTMKGGAGNDTYVVNLWSSSAADPRDLVVEASGKGLDTVRSSVTYTLPANVETLVLTGSAATSGTGNGAGNAITGNAAANVLKGLGGVDVLSGAAGADKVYGGAGADKIYGGAGNDVLRGDDAGGSKAADRFYFDTALNAKSNKDKIEDFDPARDFIHLSKGVFAKAGAAGTLKADAFHTGAAAADAEDRIVYNKATGVLSYDADGTGPTAAVAFATVTPGLVLSNADFIVF